MGVVTSKSKRGDTKSEQRNARPLKVGKRASNINKNCMLMTALDGVDCNWHNGDEAAAVTGKDVSGTAGHRDAARAWTDVEESGKLVQKRSGTIKVMGQRSSWGEMKIYDVEPEAEMRPPRVTSVRQPEATGDVVTDGRSNHDNVVVTTSAEDDVVGSRTSTAVPLQRLPEAIMDRARISTGGITTTGILSLPMTTTSRVCHGDGLPDVECVARGNERKEGARCQPLRPDELLGKSFANVSQNGNSATGSLVLPKRVGLRPLPIPSACAYGCTYPASSTSPAGDFRRRLSAGRGSSFVVAGAADGEHLAPDHRSCCADRGGCTLVVMMATTDAVGADAQHPASAQGLHPMAVSLAQQSSLKKMEKMIDQGTWLLEEEEQPKETIKVPTKEEMKVDREVEELAEGRMIEQTAKDARPNQPYVAGEKPTEQMVEQPGPRTVEPQTLYSKQVCPPQGDATPGGQSLEESGMPKWTEAAEEVNGKEDSDGGLTEDAAKEDAADSPEEVGDMEAWYQCDVTLHCTSQHPSAVLRSSSRNSGDPDARLLGSVTHESAELFGKVSAADVDEHCNNGDAVLIRGDAERCSEKVAVVTGDCIHGDAEPDASKGDARPMDHVDADAENARYSSELQHVLDRHCSPSTGMPAVRDVTLTTSFDRCLDSSPTGNDSRNAAATWSDSEVAGNDSEIAWSDAWVTWSDTHAKDKDGEGDGEGGGEGGDRGRAGTDTFFDQTKPSKDPLPRP